MTTPSPRLGLALPTQGDRFSTADLRANWEKLDAAPGTVIVTSSTRPTGWGAGQTGRQIYETNTGLEWVWTGSAWKRKTTGTGILKLAGGTPAIAERTTNFSTSSTTYVKVVGMTGVVVPAGNRPLMLTAAWEQADNSAGPFVASIFRSNTNDSGPLLSRTNVGPATSGRGAGGSIVSFERNGLSAGSYDFSLQIRSLDGPGGTSWMYGSGIQPIQLTIVEL